MSTPTKHLPTETEAVAGDSMDGLCAQHYCETQLQEPPYTVFSRGKVWFIICMAAFAGLVSPLSATIYLPALNVISRDLAISEANINLTLLTYMIWQGLAPVLLGDLADTAGRRPVFIIGFLVYIGANIGLALQDSFGALLALRMLQSAGTSSTVAIAAGVAADVSPPSSRGKVMGWVTCGTALGTAIGPVLGGVLSQYLGWRCIFWFLVILIGTYMIPLTLAFPETGRNVVGNGSIPPQGWNHPFWSYFHKRHHVDGGNDDASLSEETRKVINQRRLRFRPWVPVRLIFHKDFGLLLFYNAIVYASFTAIIASTPYLFDKTYNANDLEVGLAYIPFGVGSFLAPLLSGRWVDQKFHSVAASLGLPEVRGRASVPVDFPLERARIPVALPQAIVGALCLVAYGWVIHFKYNIAIALILQFLIATHVTGCFQVVNIMIVDYYPKSPSTATAANNLCRCWLGGATGALIVIIIRCMGVGWCFTFVGFVLLAATPIPLVLLRWGGKWRQERMSRSD